MKPQVGPRFSSIDFMPAAGHPTLSPRGPPSSPALRINPHIEPVQEFPRRLALATAEKPLILFSDALDRPWDQIAAIHGALACSRGLMYPPGDILSEKGWRASIAVAARKNICGKHIFVPRAQATAAVVRMIARPATVPDGHCSGVDGRYAMETHAIVRPSPGGVPGGQVIGNHRKKF
jgi:hypothetical protein